MEVEVYLFMGLLESGKTTMLLDALKSPDFREDGPTLVIACEEGEVEYDPAFLEASDATLVQLEEEEELTTERLMAFDAAHRPHQVMMEYNGTWGVDRILDLALPRGWKVYGVYATVNGETAELYLNNMRSMFMEPLFPASLIIFNRCGEDLDRKKFRRNIKAINPRAQIVFEREDGTEIEETEEDLPFEWKGDRVEIEEMDYGIWYVDAMEHPERYEGKTICFLAQVYRAPHLGRRTFVPGRFVMTCCANDIQFLGFLCHYDTVLPYKTRDWVRVEVEFGVEYQKLYGEEGPVLHLKKIQGAPKPQEDVVSLT